MRTETWALFVSAAAAVISGISAFYSYRADSRSKRAVEEASASLELYLEDYFKKNEDERERFVFNLSVSNPSTRAFSISEIELKVLIEHYSEIVRTIILRPDKVDCRDGQNDSDDNIFYLDAGKKRSFKVEFSASRLDDAEKGETKSYQLLVRDTRGQVSSQGIKLIRTF